MSSGIEKIPLSTTSFRYTGKNSENKSVLYSKIRKFLILERKG